MFSSFPFTLVANFAARSAGGFQMVQDIATGRVLPRVANPSQITGPIVNPTCHAPVSEQFSFQMRRQLVASWALTTGRGGTKGTALFMSRRR